MQTRLKDRAAIAVSGPEAKSFLQGLVTNDVEALAPGRAMYAALLTPQGKILFDFLMVEDEDEILIDCAAAACAALEKRLKMYRLRAKVEIAARPDLTVAAGWEGEVPAGLAFDDPRLPALGTRSITPTEGLVPDEDDYLKHRLALGVPEGADFGSDKIFALDGDLDELHAIAFDKGCYVGQELTARMKHRGTARKRLLVVEADTALLPPETKITAAGREIGTIASEYGRRGFALVRLDRLAEASGAPMTADGVTVRVARQSWLGA